MRTVAALTMVMAVVVAAIPVENYGTMEAAVADSSFNMKDIYEADGGGDDLASTMSYIAKVDQDAAREGSYNGDIISIQQISSSEGQIVVSEPYKVRLHKDGNRGMISNKGNKPTEDDPTITTAGEITVDKTEFYDYVMFCQTYIDAITNFLKMGDGIVLTYPNGETPTGIEQAKSGGATVRVNGELVPPLPKISENNLKKISGDSSKITGKIGPNSEIQIDASYDPQRLAQGYYISNQSVDVLKLIQECEPTSLFEDKVKNDIEPHNQRVTDVVAICAKIAEADKKNNETPKPTETVYAEITEEQYASWKALASDDYEAKRTGYQTLKLSVSDLAKSESSTLPKEVDWIIRHCAMKDNNSQYSLMPYELVSAQYKHGTTNEPVWLARSKDGIKNADQLDRNGYLVTKEVAIDGIMSKAFGEAGVSAGRCNQNVVTVKLAGTVKYIGEQAFAGCQQLDTVNAEGVQTICNKAFIDSGLSSITFSSKLSTLTEIGVQAFEGTNLTEIELPSRLTLVGAGAFQNSKKLATVKFVESGSTGADETEHTRSAQGTALNALSNATKIDRYAFYNCDALQDVVFLKDKTYEIMKGAFSMPITPNEAMTEFTFPDGNTHIDFTGVSDSSNTEANNYAYDYILAGRALLKTVTFGRTLADDNVIPVNTLKGCSNLEDVYFLTAIAEYATYNPTQEKVIDEQLFSSVVNDKFMVHGPGTLPGKSDPSNPRRCSWTGTLGFLVGKEGDQPAPVPYEYEEGGVTYIELGYNNGQYVATIEVTGENTAILTQYKQNPFVKQDEGRLPLDIPEEVGKYKIVGIGEDCFDDSIKNRVYRVTINGAEEIAAGAFKGCKYLEWVTIGSSVTKIGSEAFAECPMLENVEFESDKLLHYVYDGSERIIQYLIDDADETWASQLVIEDPNAFATGSQRLTFHGAIHNGYAPFEIAMSGNTDLLASTKQICYKTDEPLNLTVMRNRTTDKATLIDYPHYQEIDDINREYLRRKDPPAEDSYSIISQFEENCVDSDKGMEDDFERAIVEAALNIELPNGIESLSTHLTEINDKKEEEGKGFFDGITNQEDFDYVRNYYIFNQSRAEDTKTPPSASAPVYEFKPIETRVRNTSSSLDITKIYGKDGYITDADFAAAYNDDKVALGGLFSGWFNDNGLEVSTKMAQQYALNASDPGLIGKTYNNHEYKETYKSGNDYLTSIRMDSVAELQDYSFDSCENLLKASFSSDLEKVGALPFRNCKSVYSIELNGNTNFKFEDMILYAANGDGKTYTIKECLEGRGAGNEYLSTSVGVIEGVTEIEDGAFSHCEMISEVHLEDSEITRVPIDCFRDAKMLKTVYLPKTVRQIDSYAFYGTNENPESNTTGTVDVHIPTPNCVITTKAIDGKNLVVIHGPRYMQDGVTESDLYHSYKSLLNDYGDDHIQFADSGNQYTVEFVDRDLKTVSRFEVDKGASLEQQQIPEAPQISGYEFKGWLCRVGDATYGPALAVGHQAFININEDRMYYPAYETNPNVVVPDGHKYKFEFENATATLIAADGKSTQLTSGAEVDGGAVIYLTASNQTKFQYWSAKGTAEGDTNSYDTLFGGGTTNYMTTFTMPNADVKVTAHLSGNKPSNPDDPNNPDNPDNPDNPNNPDNPDNPDNPNGDDNKTKYKVTVNYGSGSGEYEAGATVTISAYAPESTNRVFSKWTTNNSNLGFVSATATTTTFVMPAEDVTVTANYKVRSDDDDDDDDDTGRRPGTSSNTTTVTNRPGNSTGTTGTTGTVTDNTTGTVGGSDNGNRIYITKNGVSNKDVASVSVEGSTDNFIVRITETDEATAAVEEALINKYGSLDGLVYFPMDISLYDSTGQHKITDTYGLNITITMPIPDVLIQYGGNNRVAAADNGNLQQLTPRFTTIDGIACISFVPPHFSPYVIYVDTNNLVAGQMLDATPTTGDPIHPKWFAAIGMACISILLFVMSDGKKRRNYRTV